MAALQLTLDPGREVCLAISRPTFCPARILLPIDSAEPCARAAHRAAALARLFDSELTVLHVQNGEAGVRPSSEKTCSPKARERIEAFESTTLEDVRLRRVLLRNNDPGRAILEFARRDRMRLILMPTDGSGPFFKLIPGSVTEKVLQGADCPVWISTNLEESPRRFPRTIVCAVDRDSRARRVLEWARDFTRTVGAALTLVHAILPFHRTREHGASEELRHNGEAALKRRLDEFGFRADVHVEIGYVAPVVTTVTKNLNADLLVIGRRSEDSPFGSIETNSYSLIRNSNCSVVSV